MENTAYNVLQTEVDFYRQNQSVVDQEVRALISDNEKLSRQVKMLLKERLESEAHQDVDYSKELEDLRKQVNLIAKERDSIHVLWQTSQRTIEALENELQTYQGYEKGNKQDIKEENRGLELKLDTALRDYIELESKYKELQKKNNTMENELINREKEINTYKERGKTLENKLEKTAKDLEENRINLAVERKNNEDLKSQLTTLQKEYTEKVKKEMEAKSKVAEALQLFDLVTREKNELQKKLAKLTGEMSTLKQTLTRVKQDTESSYRAELDEVKEKYNEKVADMLEHIRNLDTELVEKGLLLSKTLRENKVLQASNESYLKQQRSELKSVDPRLALAEQRIEALFQELVASERRNIQLVCEKQSLAIDIQRIQDSHTRETKRRDWEEKLLKSQCDELKVQVEHLQKSLDETHDIIGKLQTMLTSRTELNLKMVSTKEEELAELHTHLDNQMELCKKWKESYVEMTTKLKKRLDDLQQENKELRSKLKLPSIASSIQDDSSIS
ncbi:dynein regulatory complex subunit 4-like [Cydia amplana]|uniref:dynein regulatory complex subunit 4-like n=1 Tax=Cydia amplana TaxID=1869771 RepID=UPI002FE502D6